jgi:hypothetical protein
MDIVKFTFKRLGCFVGDLRKIADLGGCPAEVLKVESRVCGWVKKSNYTAILQLKLLLKM